ncbi:MAG: metallophosphoesterase, partial [Methanothrix sp.]
MKILVMSDIHGNINALDAVLKEAGKVERVWCLGDLVG